MKPATISCPFTPTQSTPTGRAVRLLCCGVWAAVLLPACEAKSPPPTAAPRTAAAAASAVITPPVRALMDKTLKNLKFVEGGSFQMGDFGPLHSPEKLPYSSATDNKPAHKVSVDSFSINAYKTTYADHDVYSAATGKTRVGMDRVSKKVRYADAAAGLNWREAREYCQWLGGLLQLPMDLPTEAQWEYAARNRGQMLLYATDNGKIEPGRNVWSSALADDYLSKRQLDFPGPSLALGQFPPTPLGLHDMVTDGFEWVLDWYDPGYYATSVDKNPAGPASGQEKVLRSSAHQEGNNLAMGDGLSFTRRHRHPDPPKVNPVTFKPDPESNMTSDTTARCVVNSGKPLQAAR
jgi:formylglycine-generating enzyme required for sulfatase activity